MGKEKRLLIIVIALLTLFTICGFIAGNRFGRLNATIKQSSEEGQSIAMKSVIVNDVTYDGEQIFTDGVIYAVYDGEETLTFAGNGAVTDREQWVKLSDLDRKKVRTIVFENGITYIDSFEFEGQYGEKYDNLENVIVKTHLSRIKQYAFVDNVVLKNVVFEEGCDVVEDLAFYRTSPDVSGITPSPNWFDWAMTVSDSVQDDKEGL